jgi:hypothetical protein
MLMVMVKKRPTGTEMHKPTPLYFFSTVERAFCYGTCIIIYYLLPMMYDVPRGS